MGVPVQGKVSASQQERDRITEIKLFRHCYLYTQAGRPVSNRPDG